MRDQSNYILAIALSLIILVAWQYFYAIPQMERQEDITRQAEQAQTQPVEDGGAPLPQVSEEPGDTPAVDEAPTSADMPGTAQPQPAASRGEAIAASPRVPVDTPGISGSVSLQGGRIDDVVLKRYRASVEPDSPNIVLLSPSGSPDPYYAELGWIAAGDAAVPGRDTLWSAPDGAELTPGNPVTLTWDNDEGLEFRRTIEVDAEYMFTVTDEVENVGDAAVTLYPYGLISRHGTPEIEGFFILHEGLIGVLGDHGLQEIGYSDVEGGGSEVFRAEGGWLGITDKYWAAVLIPDQREAFEGRFLGGQADGQPTYQTDFRRLDGVQIAPGASASETSRVFAGAKRVDLVDGYEASFGIERFELLIDWGWFYFITKPLFFVIDWFFRLVGNFGVAILLTTVVIKLIFFPLANKSYVSMSRMKKVQPRLLEIRDRYKDDKLKQQQAMMDLYRQEKINPLSGCLPILIQIPVFFALYKVLFVTIEMRHAPFFGWIQDLAAPDPTSIFNLFGLIPWDPPLFLMIGIWPLIMGVTMWIQMRLNPPPPDPTQAMIFNWMPVVFTFLLATFPAGLVIYWAWNNFLSILQQWFIMHRQGVEVNLFGNIAATFSARKRQELAEREAAKAAADAEEAKRQAEAESAAKQAQGDEAAESEAEPESGEPAGEDDPERAKKTARRRRSKAAKSARSTKGSRPRRPAASTDAGE